jgi:hypothetical protein
MRRRSGVRDERETPRDFLRGLSRALAQKSQAISSSSSPDTGGKGKDVLGTGRRSIREEEEEYDAEELPIATPRLSLPIDVDEDSDLLPHMSAGLEDENFTMQSIELPRRAISEQPLGRLSVGDRRISDYFRTVDVVSEEVGFDSGFFPPQELIGEDDPNATAGVGDITYER